MSGEDGFRPDVPFNSARLVALARDQFPERPALAEALSACTRGSVVSVAYIHFVDPRDANQLGAAWQFGETVMLQDAHTEYLVDVLKDGRIGGVEFMSMLTFVR